MRKPIAAHRVKPKGKHFGFMLSAAGVRWVDG
jgi:hypothetical protein